ncbi:MAG: MTAP family purine nucleoside phosphorylase, partial [bacterium]|nr:MTAP family purine nucleoside phosphorylase [bacterium]
NVHPGEFVICDQFVNRTSGRLDTYFDGPEIKHVSPANPYCHCLRHTIIAASQKLNIISHDSGTLVVVQGTRFSTRAESREFRGQGWTVIGMTGYPEVILARELDICFATIALVTDYDAGLEGRTDVSPVSHSAVLDVVSDNAHKVKLLLAEVIANVSIVRCDYCNN